MSKKKEFQIDDRIDLILRSTLRAAIFASRGSEDQKNAILDVIVAAMNTDKEWKAFKESFRSAVQNEAEETLAELKTKTSKMYDELERKEKDYTNCIDILNEEKKKWAESTDAFKENEALIELVDTVFENEVDSGHHRLECKKAIFTRAMMKLDERGIRA